MKNYYCKVLTAVLLSTICFMSISCELKTAGPGRMARGELIIHLHDYVVDDELDNFVSDYSEYRFTLIERLITGSSIYLFYYDYRLINDYVFLDMIQRDEKVRSAVFN